MSKRALHLIVGEAMLRETFRAGILNGHRAELLYKFDLEPDEYAQVMAIQAQDIQEFAAAVEQMTDPRPHFPSDSDDLGRALDRLLGVSADSPLVAEFPFRL